MVLEIIDYTILYFKYKMPILMNSKPTNQVLKRLHTKLQSNASIVETNLEGSNYRYLSLVLIDIEQTNIPSTIPFALPIYPLPLAIPAIATLVQALELKDIHNEQKRLYLEFKNIE